MPFVYRVVYAEGSNYFGGSQTDMDVKYAATKTVAINLAAEMVFQYNDKEDKAFSKDFSGYCEWGGQTDTGPANVVYIEKCYVIAADDDIENGCRMRSFSDG